MDESATQTAAHATGQAALLRLRPAGGRIVDRNTFELRYAVDGGRRHASVRLRRCGAKVAIDFPHAVTEEGEPLGSAELNDELLERARVAVVALEMFVEWFGWRR
jgi:hypothetical protein